MTQLADNFLELHDEQVSAADLQAQVQARLAARRAAPGYAPQQFASYITNDTCPSPPDDLPYAFGLYHHLQRANDIYSQAETAPVLAPSPATRLPLLGRLWQLIRGETHNLILFYVNRSLAHQISVNRHLVQTLNELTRQNEAQQRAILALQAQVAALRERSQPPPAPAEPPAGETHAPL